jgi:hypothetical protein
MIGFLIRQIKSESKYHWDYLKFTFSARYEHPKRFIKSLSPIHRINNVYREYKFRRWVEYAKRHNMKITITNDYLDTMLNK